MKLSEVGYRLVAVARTGERFTSFGPYVASIDSAGLVAFYAETADGSGIYTVGPGGEIDAITEAGANSHPAHNDRGETAFYRAGRLVRVYDGKLAELADPPLSFGSAGPRGPSRAKPLAGPLGPTINSAGTVALRCQLAAGEAVAVLDGDDLVTVADTAGELVGFRGLPCVSESGAVCFRADAGDGGQTIQVSAGGESSVWASTPELSELGRFPAIDDTELVVFTGVDSSGAPGVFASRGPGTTSAVIAGGGFESTRGVLARGGEVAVFYATPRGGTLAVFSGPDPKRDRLIGFGDDFDGDQVVDLALNPVSINRSGQLAIRLGLASGGGVIARADPW